MTTHDEFATWDGAYVLGALSPADRREYEAHLRVCERVRRVGVRTGRACPGC